MSKTWKFVLAGISLVLIGGLIFVFAMTGLHWNFYRLDTTTYTAQSFNALPDSITEVQIDLDSFPLKITHGDDLTLNYFEASNANVTVKQEGSVLKINEDSDYNVVTGGMFNFGRSRYPYELTLPDGVNITFTGSNGDVRINGITTDKLYVKSTNGDVDVANSNIASVEMRMTNGDSNIENSSFDTVTVRSTNLDLDLAGVTANSLTANGTNAEISIISCTIDEISLNSTNADYDIERTAVNKLTVKGTNLDADISILGVKSEYTIITQGRRLPAAQTGTSADKFVSITGTNNDVRLQFSTGTGGYRD